MAAGIPLWSIFGHRGSQKGLSQEALALSAELDRTYISQIERGAGNPSLLVLCKLAAILETDVLDLVGEDR